MPGSPYPLPFMIESAGARYAIVERRNLPIQNSALWGLVCQAMAWVVEALRVDARRDLRWHVDEQQQVARFLCAADEYQAVRTREATAWHEENPERTMEEFDAQFDIDSVDDSVRVPHLPEMLFLIFEEGAAWASENVLESSGFRGFFYVWNTRTVDLPGAPGGVWVVSPNPMLAAPTEDNEWWLAMFSDLLWTFLGYALPLSDGRDLWLEAWQFPTRRLWLAWNSGEASSYVPDLKQRLITLGLSLPSPVYVVEERVPLEKPPELGGGWMEATRRLLPWFGDPL